jgi:peptidoglycan hydrolase-like protein with peptidoglycan-binding domain
MTTQLIKSGSKGEPVKELQTKLAKLGFTVAADGIFGPGTRAAVEELQALFGYDVDGDVGDATHKLIDQQVGLGFNVQSADFVKRAIVAQGNATALERTIQRGMEGADVRFVQRRLLTLGFSLTVDGKFGDATEKAVRALQQAFKYDVDGIVGQATHKLINQQIGYGWSANAAARPNA